MDFWQRLQMAFEQANIFRAIGPTWLLIGLMAAAGLVSRVWRRPLPVRGLLILFAPLLMPGVLLVWAAAWGQTPGAALGYSRWAVDGLWFFLVLQAGVSVYGIMALKGRRLFAGAVALFELWVTLFAWIIAQMMITGIWL